MSICHAKYKNICIVYKCNLCHRSGHLKPYCFSKMNDLKWSKIPDFENLSHHKYTNANGSKYIRVHKLNF